MTRVSLLFLLALLSCRGPRELTLGPVIEGRPPLGTGHDWEGVVGLELERRPFAILWGMEHPEDGDDRTIVRLSIRWRLTQ